MTPKPSVSVESITSELGSQQNAEAVVVVTPYSTGCCMALEMQNRGYKLICLWSDGFSETMKTHVPATCRGKLSYDAQLDEAPTLEETAVAVQEVAEKNHWTIVSCVCGGEAGVDLADALSEQLGLLTNGTDVPNRRDKKVQQELVKKAGLRSVRQAAGTKLEHVQEFLETERYPLIVKPVDSAGSDGVELCRSYEEAKNHVNFLLGREMVNGGACEEVLCQEFLQGKEYVVDHVSRDGVHKTVMVWVYDKRPVNGASFVYFGDIPVDPGSPEAQLLIPYVRGVLDAIGVRNGPSHGEVIITADGPCLVEMNCRSHGGDGIWRPLCKALTGGYDQVNASVDAYVDNEAFSRLPDKPPSPMLACGQCVDLVSFSQGTVKATPGYDLIRSLSSFVYLETNIKLGSKVVPTIDMATDNGSLVMMNASKEALDRDIATVRQLEKDNAMFEYYTDEDEDEYDDEEWEQKREQLLLKATSLDFGRRLSALGVSHQNIALIRQSEMSGCTEDEEWQRKREQLLLKAASLDFGKVKSAVSLPNRINRHRRFLTHAPGDTYLL